MREPLELVRHADVLLYGIGRAMDLAQRRGLSRAEARRLLLRAFLEEVADGIDAPATQAAVRALLGRALDTPAQEVAA